MKKSSILNNLEQKKLRRFILNPKFSIKFNLQKIFGLDNINYLLYSWVNKWLIWNIFNNSKFIGVGTPNYYTFGLSKWQRSLSKNKYNLKLTNKWDNWFFYGIVISIWNWFLQSTLTLWNVFYNEIIEKTFFLFNIWNVLIQSISSDLLKQVALKKISWKWSKLFYLWKLPWLFSKFNFNL